MAKQLNVNLSFNADTSQAKAQIQALSKSLQDIAKMPGNASNLFDDTQIKKASQAALELQQHLSKAVNVDTGKLDLSRFSSSLKTSNKDLSIYCNTLLSTGEKGQQAFLQLAQAIATADTPVTRVNKKLAEMGTTLKNTARWQISSSILHGFMGAVQSAYGYAQDLNESLNEIRIVTGQNIEQMSKFAAEANRAAKALSTTTTEYTDASLIYYQQGLSDSEVAKRTEVTIKMANAAGQSAQIVSDQLTAIWNNFYDGSKSLEYYADVMTALGAATASSTDEIAGGLEKFAAIGETIGLSYEYAASALATITSNTRQSEEVVGTALKTIFARIQGLNLGETLDDGTTLNKYSEALNKVGISIFDASGEIKNMDTLLDEMANKWDNISKAQQIALAQTVAGTRQYTQLVALMDNWDNGDNDSMTANLNTAYSSTGVLQEQADIYAESWEAAQDRVTAAAEHIYSSLLNDEFFIDLLNGFEKVLETVGGLVDGLGGLKGVVGVVGSVFLTSFAKQMPEALTNLRQNLMVFTGQSKKVMQEVQSELNVKLAEQQANPALSESYKIQLEGISKVNAMKQKLVLASKDLSNQEREEYEVKIKNVQAMYEEAAALAEKKKAAEELAATTMKTASGSATRASTSIFDNYASQQDKIGTLEEKATNPSASSEATNTYAQALETARQKAVELELQIEEVKEAYSLTADEVDVLIGTNTDQSLLAETQKKIADKVKETTKSFTDQIKQRSNLENISTSVKSQATAWQNVAKEIKKAQAAGNTKNLSKHVDETKQKMQQYLGVLQKLAQENGIKLSESMIKSMSDTINGMNIDNIEQVTQRFSHFAQVISGKANAAITTLDSSIEDLRGDMSTMQFNENEIKEMEQAAEGAATANQELSDSMTNISGAADENVQGTFKMSTALTEFASTAMSVSALITSMQSAIQVFSDEGATGFEKFGAAISVLLPLMSTFNALQALSTTLSKSSLVAKLLEAKGYAITTTATGALTIGKISETGAVVANTAAWYANPIMWIALIIVGVVAALAALVAIIGAVSKALADAYNKDAIAAEKAEASARALSEAYNEAKQSYEDMIAAMDEYKSARESLDSLTEGTKEYQEALEQANRAALELINNNPDLFKEGDYHWENGELIINDDAMNKAQQAASARESQAYAAMQMGQAEAKEARNVADETALRRELLKDSTTGKDYIAGALTGAFSTAAFGTILATAIGGPLGLAIGSVLMGTGGLLKGAVGGAAMTGSLESKKLEDSGALNKTLEQLKKDSSFLDSGAENIKATLNIDDDDIINALMENKDALLELSQAQEAQAQQERLAAQQSAMEIMQNHGYDNADEMAYSAGAVFQKANEAAYEQMLKTMSNKGGLKAGAASYFDSQGISSKDGFKVEKYDAKNGTVKYSYLDEQGQRQEMEVTAEQIAMTQAVVAAEAELLDKCKTISGAFEALDADIKQVGSSTATLSEGMKAFLSSGDTSQLTKEQYDAMAGMSSDEMKNYLASIGINDTSAQDLGYDDVAALIADMDLTSTGDKWAEYQNITAHQGTENLTLNQAKNINNALKDVADFFGEEVGHEMLDLSAAMADSLDEAAQDDFWQQLGNISDYTDANQWDAFLEAMKESEDMTDEQIKALENYVDTAKLAAKATKDLNFDEMAESVGSLRDIMKNISEGNREISDEEFATLEAQGIDTSKFAKTIDGYRYLGDSADLVADISEGIKSQFLEAEQNFENITAQAAQASQNLVEAENALAVAKEASANASADIQSSSENTRNNTLILGNMMKSLLDTVVGKLKAAWDGICSAVLAIYDVFVDIVNWIGEGISKLWDGFATWIENFINGLAEKIVNFLEDIGVDVDEWEGIELGRSNFESLKSVDEIEAEEDLIAATQQLADSIPDMVKSIEASADYLSQAELEAGRAEAESNYNTASADYENAVSTYGKDSEQAQYYEKLVAYYEAQMEAYEKALDSKAWGEVAAEGIDTKEMESYIKLLKKAHPEMEKLYESTEDYEKALLQVAVANKKMEKGVKTLSSNWDSWNDIMGDSTSSAEDIATILPDVNDAVQDILNLDTQDFSLLPSDFAQKHWDLIQDVVNGVEGSVDTLRDMAGQEILMTIDGAVDPNGNIDAELLALHQKIDNFDQSQFTVGVALDPVQQADFYAACNDIITKAGMTAEQAQAYFGSMGYDVKLKEVQQPVSEVVWNHVYRNIYDERGNLAGKVIERAWPQTFTGTTQAVAIETITPNGSYGGGIGVQTTPPKTSTTKKDSSGSGSSGSINKANKKTERYKTINDKLDDSSRASERLKNKISKTTGQEQKDLMDKLVEEEKHYKKLVEDKLKEARDYLEDDYADLNAAAAVVDVEFEFDAEGNIVNYEEEMSDLYERLDQAENDALADGEVTEAEQELIDKLQEQVETLEEAIATYDETRETAEDLEDELEDLAGMPPLPTATSDLVDIYKEVNDELDDIEDKLEKINDESDRLTGAAKIKKLRESADIEKEKLKTLKEQAKVINEDIAEKQENLDEVAARHGLSFEYDENGNISNYDEEMGRLTDEYQSMYEEYAADGEITEAEQANLDAKQDAIDEITGYADAYSSAVEEGEENAKEQLAAKYAIQDKNAEALTLTLEMNVEINERDLQRIEYYLGKMEDDFYSAAEAAALMVGNLNGEGSSFGEGGQLGAYLANLNAYQASFADLQIAYENGDISQADYVEGLKTASDGMYENLQNLQALDDAMMNYYADTLAAAGEEIAKYTDQMEHQSSVLDHYKSIMEIMGKSNDYKKMGKILEGQASLAKDQAQVAKQTMEMYKDEADKKYALYQEALARGDSAAAELYKKEYEAALQASSEAEEQYLAKTEAYAESLKAILENKLADLGQDLENALTGGTSFDQLASGLSRAASIQEEYLTTTNQIYETNKLMRTAQQEIDKSSNSIAKNRLKQFINETNQLQNQNKLSKYELEIQQAKYNLLLAEIAAEEAQSAKSTVRLQRDSEGNFGYVYTADSSKMAEAEQKLQDAQNRLYNIGLDGANQYTEKYQQTLSEMYSTLTDLQSQYLSGAFESEEEYNNAVTAAKEYYYEKLEQYSSLHAVALTTDSRVIEDAWSTQFSTMVYSTESWKNSVNTYVDEAAQAFTDWKAEMTNIETELGLDDIETAVDDVKTASQELAEELTKDGGVIDSLKDELTEVGKVTEEYANQRTTIQGLIADYEDLAASIDETIQTMLEIPEGGGLPTDADDDDPDDDTGSNNQDDDKDKDDDKDDKDKDDDDKDKDDDDKDKDDDDKDDDDGGGGSEDPAPQTGTWERIMQAYQKICSGAWGNGVENRVAKGVAEGFTEDEVRKAQQYINYTFPPSQNGLGYSAAKAKSLLGFDTGGYTGDWGGAYGKMALLHKKELVLNEGDTENFLQSMNLLDKIVAAIDLHSMNAQLGGLLSSPSIGGMREHEILEQKVHIEASFPGVSDRNELEEAFNNLINQASQYANRF